MKKTLAAVLAGIAGMMFGENVSLDGKWSLSYWPQPDSGAVRSLPLNFAAETVPATVPGNVELDLLAAGKIDDPMIGANVYKLRKFEGSQWLYSRTFTAPALEPGEKAELRFEGIDTLADVFLNGEKIGEAENMLIPHVFDVTGKLRAGAENSVQVLIRSAVIEASYATLGALGYLMSGGADGEPLRKAAHGYGWDIMPRLVSAGIWKSVSLDMVPSVRIQNVNWMVRNVNAKNRTADMVVDFRAQVPFSRLDASVVRVSLSRNGKVAASAEHVFRHFQTRMSLDVSNADLWWPRGLGEPALYDAKIELLDAAGRCFASDTRKFGLRRIELERDDCYSPERPGQFLFRVNGERVFIHGTNWSPMDALHSRDAKLLPGVLAMVRDLNCNMVRCWGGGVYESDEFFDFCDANGILVWQDFCTGCSVFPQNDRYAELTREEAVSVVLRLRNHPSLALWSGNNENDDAFTWALGSFRVNPNRDRNSRRTLADVVFEFDPSRPYLPSSPYHSPDVYAGKAQESEQHLWGPRGYYKTSFYTNSPAWFVSEIGYHGCPSRNSLDAMMTPACVYPWTDAKFSWNPEWQCKATMPFPDMKDGLARRNNLMLNQIRLMFGSVSTNLNTFIEQSQTVQAEAMKYFVEMFRSRKFDRSNGLIWWNIRDGWPIISDAIVDYYGHKKLAYTYIKQAQRNTLVMMDDAFRVIAVNDTLGAVSGHARVTDAASGKTLFDADFSVPANGKTIIGRVEVSGQGVCRIHYTAGKETFDNHYLYGQPPFDFATISALLPKAE